MIKTTPHGTLSPQMWCIYIYIYKKKMIGLHAPRFIGKNL